MFDYLIVNYKQKISSSQISIIKTDSLHKSIFPILQPRLPNPKRSQIPKLINPIKNSIPFNTFPILDDVKTVRS